MKKYHYKLIKRKIFMLFTLIVRLVAVSNTTLFVEL
jgi:hypothetical protein